MLLFPSMEILKVSSPPKINNDSIAGVEEGAETGLKWKVLSSAPLLPKTGLVLKQVTQFLPLCSQLCSKGSSSPLLLEVSQLGPVGREKRTQMHPSHWESGMLLTSRVPGTRGNQRDPCRIPSQESSRQVIVPGKSFRQGVSSQDQLFGCA